MNTWNTFRELLWNSRTRQDLYSKKKCVCLCERLDFCVELRVSTHCRRRWEQGDGRRQSFGAYIIFSTLQNKTTKKMDRLSHSDIESSLTLECHLLICLPEHSWDRLRLLAGMNGFPSENNNIGNISMCVDMVKWSGEIVQTNNTLALFVIFISIKSERCDVVIVDVDRLLSFGCRVFTWRNDRSVLF